MQTGIFDRTRLAANILMVVLVALNIFFSVQYTQNIKQEDAKISEEAAKTEARLQNARFMKLFIEKVLSNPDGTISFEDRVKLENDIRDLGDPQIVEQWQKFLNSPDTASAQRSVVLLMTLLSNKMI